MSFFSSANALPDSFYMEETYKKFVKTEMNDYYSIEKVVNNNFSSILEIYNNKIFEKYENNYINPLIISSYNDYYQITKKV